MFPFKQVGYRLSFLRESDTSEETKQVGCFVVHTVKPLTGNCFAKSTESTVCILHILNHSLLNCDHLLPFEQFEQSMLAQ